MIKIDNLYQKLKEIQKEIKLYQEKCKHKKQNIKVIGPNNIRFICEHCERVLGWPNQKDVEKWVKN